MISPAPTFPGVPLAAPVDGPPLDPMQRIALRGSVLMVFIMFSMIHQIQTVLMGFNLYLLYIVGIPAVFGMLMTGGIKRTFRKRPGVYWILFAVWLLVSVPFSAWRGGSTGIAISYLRTDLPILFLIAGTAITWGDCRRLMQALSLAAVVSLAASRLFSRVDEGRLHLSFGTVANSNDYAGHLILLLPALLWVALNSKNIVFRIISFCLLPYGAYVILSTASRGALIALGAGTLYTLIAGTPRLRIATLLIISVGLPLEISHLPRETWQRLTSLSESSTARDEAALSTEQRQYLLKTSLAFIVQHPIFGVGLGQFSNVEGVTSRTRGELGAWHETHNSYTEAGSECGLPALGLMLAGIGSSILAFHRVYKASRNRPEFREISSTAFCLMLSMVSFCTAIFFLNFAYFFYLPAMAGMAVAVSCAAEDEFRKAANAVSPAISQVAAEKLLPQNPRALNLPGRTIPGVRTPFQRTPRWL